MIGINFYQKSASSFKKNSYRLRAGAMFLVLTSVEANVFRPLAAA
jgi:hypothetical protein